MPFGVVHGRSALACWNFVGKLDADRVVMHHFALLHSARAHALFLGSRAIFLHSPTHALTYWPHTADTLTHTDLQYGERHGNNSCCFPTRCSSSSSSSSTTTTFFFFFSATTTATISFFGFIHTRYRNEGSSSSRGFFFSFFILYQR